MHSELESPLLEPIGARVIIQMDRIPERSSGGIVIQSRDGMGGFMSSIRAQTGTVLATGGDEWCPRVRPGDRVMFSEHDFIALREVTGFPKTTHQILLNEAQILGKPQFDSLQVGASNAY